MYDLQQSLKRPTVRRCIRHFSAELDPKYRACTSHRRECPGRPDKGRTPQNRQEEWCRRRPSMILVTVRLCQAPRWTDSILPSLFSQKRFELARGLSILRPVLIVRRQILSFVISPFAVPPYNLPIFLFGTYAQEIQTQDNSPSFQLVRTSDISHCATGWNRGTSLQAWLEPQHSSTCSGSPKTNKTDSSNFSLSYSCY